MGAAFPARGQALVDAVAVGMVGDNEDAGLGGRGSCGTKECTGQKRREGSHIAPMNERAVLTSNKPQLVKNDERGIMRYGERELRKLVAEAELR